MLGSMVKSKIEKVGIIPQFQIDRKILKEMTPKEECRYDVCVVIHKDFNVTKPAHVGKLSGGKYAVFLAVSEFWGNIFSEIERNNLSIREQPIIERM